MLRHTKGGYISVVSTSKYLRPLKLNLSRIGSSPKIELTLEEKAREWAGENILKQGSTGKLVEALQVNLILNGFNPRAIDGVFGRYTRDAVIAFQKAKELVDDGHVGPVTWEALMR